MELALYGVIGVALMVAAAAFSKRLGVAAPVLLVAAGVGLSYMPGMPSITLPSEIVLDGLLPPILYAAAISVPIVDFRRNIRTITSLSVVLVLVTAFGVGFLLYSLLPDLGFAAAVALGAIVSPPDAVAATSVGRRLGLPPRILTVLEGEGLVNDATALVLLRSAVAVAAGGIITPWAGVLDFFFAVTVAIAIGLTAGYVTVFVRSRLNDPVLDTAISLVVPFLAFVPAESIHASGVLAVVVAGLYTGHASPSAFAAQSRISDRINWRTVQFLLENGVFLLIGIEIRTLVEDVAPGTLSAGNAVLLGLVITAALIVLRFLWIGPLIRALGARTSREEKRTLDLWLLRGYYRTHPSTSKRMTRRLIRAEKFYARKRADLEHSREERIDWRGGIVLSWSGMRGVVTLAAAQSLPEETPYRSQLVLIAFTVAVVTLVLQGGTLPALIKLLGIRGTDQAKDSAQLAELLEEMSFDGLAVLDDPAETLGLEHSVDPEIVERVRQSSFLRSDAERERSEIYGGVPGETPHRLYRELRLAVVQAERESLLEAREKGLYPSRILAQAQTMLDLEETRLRPMRAEH